MLSEFAEHLIEYAVAIGIDRGWSAKLINKSYILLNHELGIELPIMLGKDPFISETQHKLMEYHSDGYLISHPANIEAPLFKTKPLNLKILEDNLDDLYNVWLENLGSDVKKYLPYLRPARFIKDRLIDIGDPKLADQREKAEILALEADGIFYKRKESLELEYLHPNIINNLGKIKNLDALDLDSLVESLRIIKNDTVSSEGKNGDIESLKLDLSCISILGKALFTLPKKYKIYFNRGAVPSEIHEFFELKGHHLSDNARLVSYNKIIDKENVYQVIFKNKLYVYQITQKIKMTLPHRSILKTGEQLYISNYRYLEFLRDSNNKPIIFKNKNNKFVLAFGASSRGHVKPLSLEIYTFNVNRRDEYDINDLCNRLERYLVAILAESSPLRSEWRVDILEGIKNLKRGLIPLNGENDGDNDRKLLEALGEYAGEVYSAMTCELEKYLNFSTREEDVENYLKKFIGQLHKALCDLEIYSKMREQKELTELLNEIKSRRIRDKSQLESLEEGLKSILEMKITPQRYKPRPLYLLNAFQDGFNCEQLIYLSLYIIVHNKIYFPEIEEINICYVPEGCFRNKKIKDPHLVVIFRFKDETLAPFLFDATGIVSGLEKDKLIKHLLGCPENKQYFISYGMVELEGAKWDF